MKIDFKPLVKLVLNIKDKYGSVADYVEKKLINYVISQNPYFDKKDWYDYKNELNIVSSEEETKEKEKEEKMKEINEDKLPSVSGETQVVEDGSCASCVYYDADKNWCKNATYVFASAGGFMLYTWLGNPNKPNKCPVYKRKE